jgi:hypothetical protein
MRFHRCSHLRTDIGSQPSQIINCLGGQDDIERHSGYIIARIYVVWTTMKIATYNVNGVNGRLSVLLRWLEE